MCINVHRYGSRPRPNAQIEQPTGAGRCKRDPCVLCAKCQHGVNCLSTVPLHFSRTRHRPPVLFSALSLLFCLLCGTALIVDALAQLPYTDFCTAARVVSTESWPPTNTPAAPRSEEKLDCHVHQRAHFAGACRTIWAWTLILGGRMARYHSLMWVY